MINIKTHGKNMELAILPFLLAKRLSCCASLKKL